LFKDESRTPERPREGFYSANQEKCREEKMSIQIVATYGNSAVADYGGLDWPRDWVPKTKMRLQDLRWVMNPSGQGSFFFLSRVG
jgi:hypothetical protein